MKILKKFLSYFSFSRSSGMGVLEDNIENLRGGFSQAVLDGQRQSARVEISVPVWYRLTNSWSKWLLGRSVDHSGTGIRLALPPGVTPGTEINLRMKLPDAPRPIDIKGVVVWVEPIVGDMAERTTVECGVAFKSMRNVQNKEKLVYLIANKLCQIGLQLTRGIIAAPAQSLEELKECYRIVYNGYVARKYCAVNESQMHYHYYSLLPQSRTFALREKDQLVGTISVVVDSPCGLPMDSLFKNELNHLRGRGRKLAEVSLLAVVPDQKKKKLFSLTNLDKQVRLFRLFKIMYEYARSVGVTDLIIGVHPKHETLYKYLMFKAMGSAKSYSGARGNPALPLHMDMIAAEENCSKCLKNFFFSEPTPVDVMHGGLKMNADIVRQFLYEEQQLWQNIPSAGQKYFKQCYPGVEPRFNHPLFNIFKK